MLECIGNAVRPGFHRDIQHFAHLQNSRFRMYMHFTLWKAFLHRVRKLRIACRHQSLSLFGHQHHVPQPVRQVQEHADIPALVFLHNPVEFFLLKVLVFLAQIAFRRIQRRHRFGSDQAFLLIDAQQLQGCAVHVPARPARDEAYRFFHFRHKDFRTRLQASGDMLLPGVAVHFRILHRSGLQGKIFRNRGGFRILPGERFRQGVAFRVPARLTDAAHLHPGTVIGKNFRLFPCRAQTGQRRPFLRGLENQHRSGIRIQHSAHHVAHEQEIVCLGVSAFPLIGNPGPLVPDFLHVHNAAIGHIQCNPALFIHFPAHIQLSAGRGHPGTLAQRQCRAQKQKKHQQNCRPALHSDPSPEIRLQEQTVHRH